MLRGWRLQLAARGKRQSKSSNFKKEFSTQIFRVFPFFFRQVLSEMVENLRDVQGISRVLFDLTAKPPGTTEWE